MLKTSEYINECKKVAGIESNYALALLFKMERRDLNYYCKDGRTPDLNTCLKIAELLNLKPLCVILHTAIECEKNEVKRAFLKKALKESDCANTKKVHQQKKNQLDEGESSKQLHQQAD